MTDVKSFILGVVASLAAVLIVKCLSRYNRYSLKQDIETLELERKCLEEMKRSSVEMNRNSFKCLFLLLSLMALAQLVPLFSQLVFKNDRSIETFVSLVIWGIVCGGSLYLWKRYEKLKNYKASITKLDNRIEQKKQKLYNFK